MFQKVDVDCGLLILQAHKSFAVLDIRFGFCGLYSLHCRNSSTSARWRACLHFLHWTLYTEVSDPQQQILQGDGDGVD